MKPAQGVYGVLVRHYARRFFDSEIVSSQGSLFDSVVTAASLLGATSIVVAYVTTVQHWMMSSRTPEHVREAMAWADREFLISLSMAITGAVAVLAWQWVFPDRRDCLILSALPLTASKIIAAKITALGGLFVVATFAVNAATGLLFPIATARTMTVSEALRLYSSHAAAVWPASAFVFLAVLAAQGLLANVLPFRMFQRWSAWVQLLALFTILFVFFMIPPISSPAAIVRPENRAAALWLPPFWFTGLYQKCLGTRLPLIDELAGRALAALVISGLAVVLLYALAYRRVIRKTIEESGAVGEGGSGRWIRVDRIVDKVVVKTATERAAFHFIGRTMARSRGHRLMLAAYASIGLVYLAHGIAGVVKTSGGRALMQPNAQLSALPLILPFFVLLGLRALFAIPVEPQANWIFRLTDAGHPGPYVRAARKLMLMAGVVPVCAAALPVYGFLWGWRMAVFHVLMCLLASMATLELLMAGFRKVPFTCPYLPGKGNLKATFGVYVILFLSLAFLAINIELWLASDLRRSIAGVLLTGAVYLYAARKRRGEDANEAGILWEEAPVWHVQTLELSR
jgi:hypothetical protein